MAKAKKAWFCSECGAESTKWMGKCPSCGEWNTMVEEIISRDPDNAKTSRGRSFIEGSSSKPQLLSTIESGDENRTISGNEELDRVLGGGMVKGSMILIGGEPGIGKSTLSLQIPLYCNNLKTLYVSGEESARQIKMRGERLGGNPDNCLVLSETLLENILDHTKAVAPQLLIVDSIQTIYSQNIDSTAGSVSQVKECAASLLRYAKETETPVIIIGHITKEGSLAGPKVLEHIVDVVLQFEGDTRHSYRILRSIKNRFGSTSELAVYQMTGNGLKEILNPSEMFIPMHGEDLSGAAICATIDGTRPFLIEVQALVSSAAYGMPQRSATGFDVRRMNMLLAVLEKRVGFKLSQKDVFLNVAGGIRVTDPACDLSVVASILSSNFDVPISQRTAFAAEIGLSGEIRPVSQVEKRIAEAAKLGFERIYISSFCNIPSDFAKSLIPKGSNKPSAHENEAIEPPHRQTLPEKAIKIVSIENIQQLVKSLF